MTTTASTRARTLGAWISTSTSILSLIGLVIYIHRQQLEWLADREQARVMDTRAAEAKQDAILAHQHRARLEKQLATTVEHNLKIEKQLAQADQFRQMMLAWSTRTDSGIFLADSHGKIVGCNPGALKLTGYDRGELVGKPIEMLVAEEFRDNHRKKFPQAMADPDPSEMPRDVRCDALKKSGEKFRAAIRVRLFRVDGQTYAHATVDPVEGHP